MDLMVITVNAVTNKVSFGFGQRSTRKITGIDKLVQLACVKLMKTPGRDVISPTTGGGLNDVIGGNINPDDIREIAADLSPKVKKAETEMIAEQIDKDLPVEERLQSLTINNVSVDETDNTSYNLEIRLLSEAGESRVISVNSVLLGG